MSLELPTGTVPVRSLTDDEIIQGNRKTTTRVEIIDLDNGSVRTLDGVTAGSVDYTAQASIHGGGSLTVVDNGQFDVSGSGPPWLNVRLRPIISVAGLSDAPLGVFLVSEAPETWSDTGRVWEVKLLDRCTILDQWAEDASYSLAAGSVITDGIVTLIESTGETAGAITPSDKTLAAGRVWEAGTSVLAIVNDLLSAANYFSLFCDFTGQYRAEPYVKPASRPIRYEFLDGDTSIYSPDFVVDVDLYGVPNKIIAIGQGDGTTAALIGTASNTSATSPYSIDARGRTITRVETDVPAADQDTITAYASRRLVELTTPTSSVDVTHAWVPGLAFNNAVRLRRVPAGIDARHVVTKTEISLDGTALVKSTLEAVVDL